MENKVTIEKIRVLWGETDGPIYSPIKTMSRKTFPDTSVHNESTYFIGSNCYIHSSGIPERVPAQKKYSIWRFDHFLEIFFSTAHYRKYDTLGEAIKALKLID